MKVLIVGGGGREHALAWKAAQSARVEKVYVAPGNAGTAGEPKSENASIAATDIPALLRFALERRIELTIVGPEGPLVAGIVDQFTAAGLRCFGPSQAAARLEGSKVHAKNFLSRHRIPTARYETFTDLHAACAYLRQRTPPMVIKADGLASGKGVILAETTTQAEQAVRDMLDAHIFGQAGSHVVIEEFLRGEEASFIVMADGEHYLPLASSQDHKALLDGDRGPNTGGMGAYSPAPVVTPAVHERVLREVIEPTLRGMATEGCPFTGFLYAGLMLSPEGEPKVLEFNCRFGDPETQPILMRLRTDLVTLCEAALDKKLDTVKCDWDPRAALGVVLAAEGYPGTVRQGDVIGGLGTTHKHVKVFHAGTALKDGAVVTAGGRVLCVSALGENVRLAGQRAYEQIAEIRWPGMQYRRDIGYRAIARERANTK
ncbi:MAG TPA: phosphoribosylamine--glycine ligase [Gammaproteobacteria bacterium]|nr:phosphoribosylamine--glycine ligase [Gammaproteobacteria bacterium]